MPSLTPSTYYKQPSEKEYIAIDFVNRLAIGDSLASITSCKCYDSDGEDVTDTMILSPVTDEGKVKLWVMSGSAGEKYDLTLQVKTSLGYILEADLKIDVREWGHA